ncbi:MAG: hypothetical protein LBP67_06695 [Bacteroidales bacterium]|jgi:ABC-type siderophore export system fused ATPase/permease subunit|nr:hypothetical protein [Bacteroidales bacterium]
MDNDNNIELRSKKIRNIIGEIPSYLSKTGFAILICLFAVFILILFFFKYDYYIKTTAYIIPKENSILEIKVNIPVNQISKINNEHLITILFDNIPNITEQTMQLKAKEVSSEINVLTSGGYYCMDFIEHNPLCIDSVLITICEPLTLNAEIYIGKIRLFDKIFTH